MSHNSVLIAMRLNKTLLLLLLLLLCQPRFYGFSDPHLSCIGNLKSCHVPITFLDNWFAFSTKFPWEYTYTQTISHSLLLFVAARLATVCLAMAMVMVVLMLKVMILVMITIIIMLNISLTVIIRLVLRYSAKAHQPSVLLTSSKAKRFTADRAISNCAPNLWNSLPNNRHHQ